MPTKSVDALQKALNTQLIGMGYASVGIKDDVEMLANLKRQLELHNKNITFTQAEFKSILNHLNTSALFDRGKTLREMFALKRNDDVIYISFLNADDLCLNQFQVTSQVTMQGKGKKRNEVTLIINGLPLVQIELLKNDVELEVAFHQVNRYEHKFFDAGYYLFQYVQLFIISNGVDTKYFANNQHQSFQQTLYHFDKVNKRLSDLHVFTIIFLAKYNVIKIITHNMVMTKNRTIKVLAP